MLVSFGIFFFRTATTLTGKTEAKLPPDFQSTASRFPHEITNEQPGPTTDLCEMAPNNAEHPVEGPSELSRKRFEQGDLVLEYAIWRPSPAAVHASVAIHGFSRPLEDMMAVRPLLSADTAVLMPHLAAHGQSSGHHRPLDPELWYAAIDQILENEGLQFNGTLIGYSLGGRVALSWWTDQPHRFDRVLVMAPDGLLKNPGYRFSVDTAVGRAWLNQSGRQRSSLVQLLNTLRSVRVLPSHFHQFSLFHLETADMWSMVIDCWISLRKFWPSRGRIRRTAKAHPGVLEAHFGERDKVIKPRNSKALKGCGPVHFHPCGHGLLRPDIIQRIASPSSKS